MAYQIRWLQPSYQIRISNCIYTKMEIYKGQRSFQMLEKYTKNPKGWNSAHRSGRRKDHFFDALVSGPRESWVWNDWILKPNPAVLGTQTDSLAKKSLTLPDFFPSYGYGNWVSEIVLKIQEGGGPDLLDESPRSGQADRPRSNRSRYPNITPRDFRLQSEISRAIRKSAKLDNRLETPNSGVS